MQGLAVSRIEVVRPCIIAGNSRLTVGADGAVAVEAQLRAFAAGLDLAARLRDELGVLPAVSVGFDHTDVFRKQFLATGLDRNSRRYPTLADLLPEVADVFRAIADDYGVPLAQISVIAEDSARTRVINAFADARMIAALRHRMFLPAADDDADFVVDGEARRPKITCAAMTAEYFRMAARESAPAPAREGLLEVFFEDASWSRESAYVRGLQLAHILGLELSIRLSLVDQAGAVAQGEIVPYTLQDAVGYYVE